MTSSDLSQQWIDHASFFRDHGLESVARTYERCAEAISQAEAAHREELLTLSEAAAESHYSPDHLGRLVRQGSVPNSGRPGAPRIARKHLPLKSRALPKATTVAEVGREQIVRSAID